MSQRSDHSDRINNNHSLESLITDLSCDSRLEECYLREPFTTTLSFKSKIAAEQIQAQLCVNKSDGRQENLAMTLASHCDNESYSYVATIAPDKAGPVEYYGVVSAFGNSLVTNTGRLTVLPPRDEEWQHRPVYEQVAEGIWVGNARAAFEAETLGFDSVLNVADQFNFSLPEETYKFIPLVDWGTNAIPKDKISEAVNWLAVQASSGKKTIINCRAGIGRSGSIAIAYLYATNPQLNYHQVVHMARHGIDGAFAGKSNIYPHVGLKESLEELYPGNNRPVTTEIRNIWLDNYEMYQCVSKKINEKVIVRAGVDYRGEMEPFVFAHCDINKHRVEDIPMKKTAGNLYEAVFTPECVGRFWLTIRASNYMTTTPWHDRDVWLGEEGDNLYFDIQE